MKIDLSTTIGALKFKNPVLVASGTFGYGTEYGELFDVSQLGGIITKTITPRPRAGNPSPRIWEVGGGMLNSIGLANVGAEEFISDKLPALRDLDTVVIVNVAGASLEEYWEVVEILEPEEGFEAYEVNISCPNVKDEGMTFGSNPKVTGQIVRGIRDRTKRPVIPKLTPNVTYLPEIAHACEDAGADAISLINTIVGMSVDVVSRKPRLATVTGGYSGPPIKPVALAKVFEAHKAVSIPIIGIGGISNATDVVEFMITGASAVQVGTANFVNPLTSVEIINDLITYCRENGISRLENLVGTLRLE